MKRKGGKRVWVREESMERGREGGRRNKGMKVKQIDVSEGGKEEREEEQG